MQGGAIFAESGVNMETSACTFQQNEAGYVSADCEVVLKLFPHKRRFVKCPPIGGAHMHQTSIDHQLLISARITMKPAAVCKSHSQLLFALLFMSIRAFSDKRTFPIFCCMSGGTNWK